MVGQVSAERSKRVGTASKDGELHAGAWLGWILAVGALAFLTSNPLYISLTFVSVLGVYLAVADSPRGRAMLPFVIFGLALAAFSVPFNLVTGSTGETVLFEFPSLAFPSWFGGVTLGGEITGEALLVSGARALGIATLVIGAAAFNSGVNHFRLLRLAPPALAQVMIVLTIAALVVPQGLTRAKSVAEGRRLRGRSTRGVKALTGLALPVLQGALEGAVQRAESLDARGFGGGDRAPARWKSVFAVAGLGLFAWGAFSHYYTGASVLSVSTMTLGLVTVVFTLYRDTRHRRTGLRRNGLGFRDWLVIAGTGASTFLILILRVAGSGDVTYLPYPELGTPEFHPIGAAAAVLLLTPALVYAFAHD